MSKSKYPHTNRIAAGKLQPGDVILIRDQQSDWLPLSLMHHVERTEGGARHLPPGFFTVTDVVPSWNERGRRASRYYTVHLDANYDESTRSTVRWAIYVSASQRLNLVVAS